MKRLNHEEYSPCTGIPGELNGLVADKNNSAVEYTQQTGNTHGKLKIVYTSEGCALVSDFAAEKWVDVQIEEYHKTYPIDKEIRVGTEYMLNLFVLRTMQNVISLENVDFYFEDIKLNLDECDGLEFPKDKDIPDGWAMWATVTMKIVKLGYDRFRELERINKLSE